MKRVLFIAIEEYLNNHLQLKIDTDGQFVFHKLDTVKFMEQANNRIESGKSQRTLYDFILIYIEKLNNRNLYKSNGVLNEAAFYRYAHIDKTTWSDIKWDKIIPKKKTLLKLIIALHLNEDEAVELLHLGASDFSPKDIRDQVILALIDLKCYDYCDVYDALEQYRSIYGKNAFENIYDTREIK